MACSGTALALAATSFFTLAGIDLMFQLSLYQLLLKET
jgi:hypothetical protein